MAWSKLGVRAAVVGAMPSRQHPACNFAAGAGSALAKAGLAGPLGAAPVTLTLWCLPDSHFGVQRNGAGRDGAGRGECMPQMMSGRKACKLARCRSRRCAWRGLVASLKPLGASPSRHLHHKERKHRGQTAKQ